MAKGRAALGAVEVEELAPLQDVVVTQTWSGLSTDGVMVDVSPLQGHEVRLANGGSIAGSGWLQQVTVHGSSRWVRCVLWGYGSGSTCLQGHGTKHLCHPCLISRPGGQMHQGWSLCPTGR